jgi:hypothetical protein
VCIWWEESSQKKHLADGMSLVRDTLVRDTVITRKGWSSVKEAWDYCRTCHPSCAFGSLYFSLCGRNKGCGHETQHAAASDQQTRKSLRGGKTQGCRRAVALPFALAYCFGLLCFVGPRMTAGLLQLHSVGGEEALSASRMVGLRQAVIDAHLPLPFAEDIAVLARIQPGIPEHTHIEQSR